LDGQHRAPRHPPHLVVGDCAEHDAVYKESLLLSMRTTGSISVERVAKPLKNKVMTDTRANMKKGAAEVLLRAGLNLRLLRRLKLAQRAAVR